MTRRQLTDEEWECVGPYLPVGEYGPYPAGLREQFEGVIWKFRSGAQRREMPAEFGAWSTVHNRFRQWRDVGVLEALLEGLIAKAAERGGVGWGGVGWIFRWSAWIPPLLGPTMTPPGCTSIRERWMPWRRPPGRSGRPGQRGLRRGTSRAGRRRRS